MFHQIEGFLVDENVSFAELKGVLTAFAERLYGAGHAGALPAELLPVRRARRRGRRRLRLLRSADGTRAGCRVCKHTGWIEVLGCGMIHPGVFEHCGIDPESTPASRSAWASSASRCSATASRTSG